MQRQENLAARAGRWSAAHRKTAIFGWLAFVVAALVIGSAIGTKALDDGDAGAGASGKAQRVLADAFPQPAGESVLVQARSGQTFSDPAFRAAVKDVTARVSSVDVVKNVRSPLAPGNADQVSKDARSALVEFDIRGDSDDADKRITPVLDQVAAAQRAHPQLRVEEFGDASAGKALGERFDKDFQQAETLSLPITLAILIVTFGALVAAGLPVLLGLTSVAAAIGLAAIPSQFMGLDDAVQSVILLIGLAVGVDYSLFYMRREREERAKGADMPSALRTAAATSGHAVLVSGVTVLVAMAGMYLTGNKVFMGMATGTMLVVAIAMIGSVTVLPAMLSWLGDRIEKGRVPFLHRLRRRAPGPEGRVGESRAWNALLSVVLRRPALSGIVALALLVVLAIPAFSLHTADSGTQGLPRDMPIMRTYDRIQAAFPGGPMPAQVVVQAGDVTSPRVADALAQLKRDALARPDMGGPVSLTVSDNRRVAVMSIPLAGSGTDDRSNAALAALRDTLIPKTIGAAGAKAGVTGMTAGSKDFNDLLAARSPLVFAFVLGLAFLLLLFTFRSIVIPLTAIGLNLLSVGAAYGVLTWIFQEGHLEGLLGFNSIGAITAWLPLFLFVILFGLSMDYHVFILSRIKEGHDRGLPTDRAISEGIRSTASVVTSAAIIMVAVFAIFATLSMLDFKEMGVGLAAAILIDATIVRGVLLPATMKLLGHRNWYLPRWLEWIPQRRHQVPVAPAREAEPEPV